MPPEDAPAPTAMPTPRLPPRWVRPVLLVAAWAMLLAAVADVSGFASLRHPANAFHADGLRALFYVLVPTLLLYTLFDARRGIERGHAAETGILPGLLLFGGLMFANGSVPRFIPNAPGLGLLLLAAFATARADPPAPPPARLVWALLAVGLGAWGIYEEPSVAGGVGALVLYAGWSAWRGASNGSTMPPARRLIEMLLFVWLLDMPIAAQHDVASATVPLRVAAGLVLLEFLSLLRPANRPDSPP